MQEFLLHFLYQFLFWYYSYTRQGSDDYLEATVVHKQQPFKINFSLGQNT